MGIQKNRETFRKRIEVKKDVDKCIQEKSRKEPNHFKEIEQYLTEKRKLIYAKAQSSNYEIQRRAILQWDKMDNLIEKLSENKNEKRIFK